MQDMLIYQFNTKGNLAGTGKNIFGMGEDRQVGGEGANADMQENISAQGLSGGGLWWGGEGFNMGHDATQEAQKEKKGRGRGKRKGGVAPTPAEIAAPPPPVDPPSAAGAPGPPGTPQIPDYKEDMLNPTHKMLQGNYGGSPSFGGSQYF
jgi:hypothetical protein